jgi:hypothetical protein
LRNVKRVFRTVVTASALALVSIAAHSATDHLTGDLKASAEVPPKDSPGAGTVTATLDTETNEFKYHVEFSGLTGPVVAAHFHGPACSQLITLLLKPAQSVLSSVVGRSRTRLPVAL